MLAALVALGALAAAQDLAAVRAVDAWLAGGKVAPAHWTVGARDLAPKWAKLGSGFYKEVRATSVVLLRRVSSCFPRAPASRGREYTSSFEPA